MPETTAPTITVSAAMDDIRLRLAVADAAVAYHDLGARKPLDLTALRDGWEVLERAVAEWRSQQ